MQLRTLGATDLSLSVLGFGCGAVGGLMVRGAAADQERAVARAIELGINYFDTAPMYGNGASERNLGRVLKRLGYPPVHVGTKVLVGQGERGDIARAVSSSLEASLQRLGLDSVDLFYLHNFVSSGGEGDTLSARIVLEQVARAFERLRDQGKARYFGFTALGETPQIHEVIGGRALAAAQVSYNLLNPSAGQALPPGYPAQDYARLLDRAQAAGMGGIGIRVLAGGALSAAQARHPLGMAVVEPIGSGGDYAADVRRAQRLAPLIEAGYAASLIEAALRFAISHPVMTSVLVGYSTLEQLEYAASAAQRGPLPSAGLEQLTALQRTFVGEAR